MKEQSIKYLLGKGSPYLRQMKNQKTARQYTHITARFSLWLSEQGIKRPTQLKAVYGPLRASIQAWVDALVAQGLPVVYDRLALLAVSVFHLSHWRLDVTTTNYMLAG